MQRLGNLGIRPQINYTDRLKNRVNGNDVQKVETNNTPNYTIDDILDMVEEGDISILDKLGIPYTDILTKTEDKKLSFKYENTRYTVNNIEKKNTKNEVKEVPSNTKTVKNNDGSYTVFEYSLNGSSLIKSTEYDKDNNITHVFQPKADGSRSDKYYSYVDGSLFQIQETIHYPDGNYTYIFTDGNGNFKQKQKVTHNEQGGLTFDTTDKDGTRNTIAQNADKKTLNTAYYTSDGKLDYKNEYFYDSQNPNLFTILKINADGRVLSEERYEEHTFTDENGRVWNGCRLLEKVITEQEEDAPIPPSIDNFINFDGSIDEEGYAQAFEQYVEAKKEYDKLSKQYSNAINEPVFETEIIKNINSAISTTEEKIAQLKNFGNFKKAKEIEKKLEILKNQYSFAQNERNSILKLENILLKKFEQMHKPVPPKATDYITDDNWADEAAYEKAMQKYYAQKNIYDKTKDTLNKKQNFIHEKLNRLNDIMTQIHENIISI